MSDIPIHRLVTHPSISLQQIRIAMNWALTGADGDRDCKMKIVGSRIASTSDVDACIHLSFSERNQLNSTTGDFLETFVTGPLVAQTRSPPQLAVKYRFPCTASLPFRVVQPTKLKHVLDVLYPSPQLPAIVEDAPPLTVEMQERALESARTTALNKLMDRLRSTTAGNDKTEHIIRVPFTIVDRSAQFAMQGQSLPKHERGNSTHDASQSSQIVSQDGEVCEQWFSSLGAPPSNASHLFASDTMLIITMKGRSQPRTQLVGVPLYLSVTKGACVILLWHGITGPQPRADFCLSAIANFPSYRWAVLQPDSVVVLHGCVKWALINLGTAHFGPMTIVSARFFMPNHCQQAYSTWWELSDTTPISFALKLGALDSACFVQRADNAGNITASAAAFSIDSLGCAAWPTTRAHKAPAQLSNKQESRSPAGNKRSASAMSGSEDGLESTNDPALSGDELSTKSAVIDPSAKARKQAWQAACQSWSKRVSLWTERSWHYLSAVVAVKLSPTRALSITMTIPINDSFENESRTRLRTAIAHEAGTLLGQFHDNTEPRVNAIKRRRGKAAGQEWECEWTRLKSALDHMSDTACVFLVRHDHIEAYVSARVLKPGVVADADMSDRGQFAVLLRDCCRSTLQSWFDIMYQAELKHLDRQRAIEAGEQSDTASMSDSDDDQSNSSLSTTQPCAPLPPPAAPLPPPADPLPPPADPLPPSAAPLLPPPASSSKDGVGAAAPKHDACATHSLAPPRTRGATARASHDEDLVQA